VESLLAQDIPDAFCSSCLFIDQLIVINRHNLFSGLERAPADDPVESDGFSPLEEAFLVALSEEELCRRSTKSSLCEPSSSGPISGRQLEAACANVVAH